MQEVADRPRIGPLLREWRERRRLSQLDLALGAGVSARHVSFIETGRSRPSADMVMQLAEHLDVPLRDRNTLLLAAGYAPAYAQRELADPEMGPVRDAIERVLRGHEPYPAVVIDRHWGLVAGNSAVPLLTQGVADHLLEPPVNVLRLSLHPEGLAPRIVNLGEWRAHLLDRLGRQAVSSGDPALFALHEELAGYPGGGSGHSADLEAGEIAVPLRIRTVDGAELSFLSTATTFGTAVDVTVSELSIESFFPADEATRCWMRPGRSSRGGDRAPPSGGEARGEAPRCRARGCADRGRGRCPRSRGGSARPSPPSTGPGPPRRRPPRSRAWSCRGPPRESRPPARPTSAPPPPCGGSAAGPARRPPSADAARASRGPPRKARAPPLRAVLQPPGQPADALLLALALVILAEAHLGEDEQQHGAERDRDEGQRGEVGSEAADHDPAQHARDDRRERRSVGPDARAGSQAASVPVKMLHVIQGIDHVQVAAPSGCEEAARRFYGELLGLEEIPKPAALAQRGGAWFSLGRQQLHVGVADPFEPARKAHPALLVAAGRLDALAERLADSGAPVSFDHDLPGVRRFYTEDPWGNRIELLATRSA